MRLLLIMVMLLFLPVAAMAQSAGQKLGGGGGGGGTPGGDPTEIQFNTGGAFDGSPDLTWSGTVLNARRISTDDIDGDNAVVFRDNDTNGYTTVVTAGNLALVVDSFSDSGDHAGKFVLFNNADGLVGDMMSLNTSGHYRNCPTGTNLELATTIDNGTVDTWCLHTSGNMRYTAFQLWGSAVSTPTRYINALRLGIVIVDESTGAEITKATWRVYGDGGLEDRMVLESDGMMNFLKGDGAVGIKIHITDLASPGTSIVPGSVTVDNTVTLPVVTGPIALRSGYLSVITSSALSEEEVQGGRVTVTGGSGIVITLPDTEVGMDVCIVNGVAQTLTIDVDSTNDFIYLPGSGLLSGGDSIDAPASPNDEGASVCLYTDAGVVWYVYAMVGIWVDGDP